MMTVKELIEELQKYDEKIVVAIRKNKYFQKDGVTYYFIEKDDIFSENENEKHLRLVLCSY